MHKCTNCVCIKRKWGFIIRRLTQEIASKYPEYSSKNMQSGRWMGGWNLFYINTDNQTFALLSHEQLHLTYSLIRVVDASFVCEWLESAGHMGGTGSNAEVTQPVSTGTSSGCGGRSVLWNSEWSTVFSPCQAQTVNSALWLFMLKSQNCPSKFSHSSVLHFLSVWIIHKLSSQFDCRAVRISTHTHKRADLWPWCSQPVNVAWGGFKRPCDTHTHTHWKCNKQSAHVHIVHHIFRANK